MKKLTKLIGVKALNNKEQKNIKGGGFEFPNDDCICIYMGPNGYLVLDLVGRDGLCPDGSLPDCGFIGRGKQPKL